jgi:glycine betaine catabolism B
MAGTALLGRLTWQIGEVTETREETPRVRSLVLDLPSWPGHRAGQHLDVRLTAEDGYQAVRSYSLASSPDEGVAITVERLDDGEVSPYLVDEVHPGDSLEFRGPIGGYFVWEPSYGGPLYLVGGGSGVVPLMAMIRHRKASGEPVPVALLLSSRTWGDVLFRDELLELENSLPDFALALALTREPATRRTDFSRRIDARMVADVAARLPESPGCAFVCGSNAFVDIAADAVLALGLEAAAIKTERYGA